MNEYLESPDLDLWRLAEDGDSFVWSADNSTIAFPTQVATILQSLMQSRGAVPNLTAVLFVVAALAKSHDRMAWRARVQSLGIGEIDSTGFDGVIDFLDSLSKLPEDLRTGPASAAAVLGCGLEGARQWLNELSGADANAVIDTLNLAAQDRPQIDGVETWSSLRIANERRRRVWQTLVHLSCANSDAESLRNWRRTGLASLLEPVEPAALEVQPRDPISRLVQSIKDDPELGVVAAMCHSIASLVSLPRRPSDPDQMPMGGVSDVTNRGNPDRLLMTELAAEPMMLMARIAMGQALYLRRETPPGPAPKRRQVLIELSVRCWGETRVRMAALALGVGVAEERRGETRADFVSVGQHRFAAVALHTRAGLVEHLEQLELAVHPGRAVARWANAVATVDDGIEPEPEAEPLLIVTDQTDRDSDFQASTIKLKRPFLVARIGQDGNVVILRRGVSGDDVLQRMSMTMPIRTPRIHVKHDDRLPLAVRLPVTPIAFCTERSDWSYLSTLDASGIRELWCVTSDRRLLHCTRRTHGGEELISALNSSHILAAVRDADSLRIVVGSTGNADHLISVQPHCAEVTRVTLASAKGQAEYAFVGRSLIRCVNGVIETIRQSDGIVTSALARRWKHVGCGYQQDPAGTIWMPGGAGDKDWEVLYAVPSGATTGTGCVVTGPDRLAHWVSDDLSRAVPLDGQNKKSISLGPSLPRLQRCRVLASSACRQRWLIEAWTTPFVTSFRPPSSSQLYCLDLKTPKVELVRSAFPFSLHSLATLDRESAQFVQDKAVRSRFTGIGFSPAFLVLGTARFRRVRLQSADSSPRRLVVAPDNSNCTLHEFGRSESVSTLYGPSHWTLRRAVLPGGSAWLDSRGLLHLERDDDSRSLVLTLCDNHVSGWFSETGFFGQPYFLAGRDNINHDIAIPLPVLNWLNEWTHKRRH